MMYTSLHPGLSQKKLQEASLNVSKLTSYSRGQENESKMFNKNV